MAVHRVLMVNRFFYPFLGGVEFHILNLSLELQRLGVEVAVATPRRDHAGPDTPFRGIPVHRFQRLSDLGRIVGQGWDVVHAHMPRNVVAAAAIHFAGRAHTPSVLTPHAFYPSRTAPWRLAKAATDLTLTRWMLRRCAATINLTAVDQADAIARGLQPDRSHIVPNSVRASELAAVPEESFAEPLGLRRPFLLHVGRFDPVKNVDFLVRAHRRIEDVDLVLIGPDGPGADAVRPLLNEPALRGRVHLVARASFSQLCNAYRECAALVMASSFEGLPTVLLEALFFGRPVVASRVGGIPHLLTDPILGGLFDGGDEADYQRALDRALADDTPAAAIARRRHVDEGYTWEVNAARVLQVYESAQAVAA